MSSSTSSSDWRRFFRVAAGTAAIVTTIVYAFVSLVDPFDTLPLSPPAERAPVASNARFSFPALARSERFDSAIFGTSTSRLLRPEVLNQAFDARFANLSMNDATPYEQARLMAVFRAAHVLPRFVLIGLDIRYCTVGKASEQILTPRPFPAWMYDASPWRGYGEMFNLYAVQSAGQQFGVLSGIKQQVYGSDGYTTFVPPDHLYDAAKVAARLRADGQSVPPGDLIGDPKGWDFPALDRLQHELAAFPAATRKLLYFVPYNHQVMPPAGTAGATAWNACKRRAAETMRQVANTRVIDFMRPSPITSVDDNYWDSVHYRLAVAERVALDLAKADRGEMSPDYVLLDGNDAISARN